MLIVVKVAVVVVLLGVFGLGFWIAPWMLRNTNNPPENQALPLWALRIINGLALSSACTLRIFTALPWVF